MFDPRTSDYRGNVTLLSLLRHDDGKVVPEPMLASAVWLSFDARAA
jgi:hypothetical protein